MLLTLPNAILSLCRAIQQESGSAYLAGGIVRDALLGREAKDIDLEIHGLTEPTLHAILTQFGQPKAVGKSFGVFKMMLANQELDIALSDAPNAKEASRRRDLTINSMLYDPLQDSLVDPFQGKRDLERKLLVATDPAYFVMDPLRVLRVAQFSARFAFNIDPALRELCQQIDISNVAAERVVVELEKSWLKSRKPAIAIQSLLELRVIEKYFSSWQGIDQPQIHEALNRAKIYCTDNNGWNMALFWSITLHHCSKEETTAILDQLQIFRYYQVNIREVVFASQKHTVNLADRFSIPTQNHAAEAFRLDLLCYISESLYPSGYASHNLKQAIQRGIDQKPLPQLLTGRDLLSLGLRGKDIGDCLSHLRGFALNDQIHCKEEALLLATDWLHKQKTHSTTEN